MTFLERYKYNYFSRHSQLILFDFNGYLMESCDSLFSTQSFANTSMTSWFLFMESVFESLKTLEIGEKIKFNAVEPQFSALPGIYDFDFFIHLLDKQKICCWVINDCTEQYKQYQIMQQESNDLKIIQEHLHAEILKLRSTLEPTQKPLPQTSKRFPQER